MDYDDRFDPTMPNDLDPLHEFNRLDRGLNYIQVKTTENNVLKRKRVKVYTSGGCGTRIRDAETGEYYPHKVGSKDEQLYYKVMFSTGECNSPNGSNTAFYCSPHHYCQHMKTSVPPEQIATWERNRNQRLKEIEKNPR